MSKRIITTILLLAFLTFNLTACFDTDDLFDNVNINAKNKALIVCRFARLR